MSGVLGKYRLDQRLGGGGMAEVFLASTIGAEGFSRRVAIKRVLPGYSDNDTFAKMFVAEARLSSQLVHPNIVSVLDFDRDADHRLFLVMELVDGKDLDALVSTGVLPIPVVIFVIAEVLRGLGFAHDLPVGTDLRGIVHRDVSPHNVLLSWEGSVKVSDFGIAKARAASEATASVFIKGKPAYMSPEQANGQPLDGRSDLFAVGIMLWEMLVGRRLFVGEDTRSTLASVLFGQVPRPRSLRGDLPKDLERVVMKLLERDLPARYATAEAAITDLLDCADAPRGGREALKAVLAERFAGQAPVRQSLMRERALSAPTPGLIAMPPGAVTLSDGSTPLPPRPAAALPSLGSLRNAPTATLDTRPGMSRARKLGLLMIAVLGSAAVAFAIVTATRRSAPTTVAAGSLDAAAPRDGAAGALPDVADAADAGVAGAPPSDAVVARAPADAAVVQVPVTVPKKDATPTQSSHPARQGVLVVSAFPVLTVYVDNKKRGDTPLTIKLGVGKHVVRLRNPDTGHDERIPVTITENQTMKIDRIK
ncbi:MAG: protein kinase [Myxococcota bacterium]|nr:protein kinase [Myxococcota bacterium]